MIGETVGEYRMTAELGRGGMGVVYRAEHTLLGRAAAMKMLHAQFSQDRNMVRRFFNEARAASGIRHPGIVEIYTFGFHADGRAYLAMELLAGESLEQRVKGKARLPVEQALRIAAQVAGALAAAHEQRIIHRDLKPDNVFLVRDPEVPGGERVKLLDFGIAKLGAEPGAPGQTGTGAVMGTPAYMAPEQCRGAGAVDHRADLYALGCVLYRMLCRRLPFPGQNTGEVIAAQLRDPPPPPRQVDPSIPAEVEAVLLRLLEKDPERRYQNALEVRVALDRVAGFAPAPPAQPAPDLVLGDTLMPGPPPTTLGSASAEVERGARSRSRAGWAIGAVAGLLAIGAALAILVPGPAGREEQKPGPIAVAQVADASALDPEPAPRVAPSEEECRRALAAAAPLMAGALSLEALPYRHLRRFAEGGEEAGELVTSCTDGYDRELAECFAEARASAAIAACGDQFVERHCRRGEPSACASLASVAYDRGDDALALEQARSSCDAGAGEGCAVLGSLHFYGRGVEIDREQALRHYLRARALDDPGGTTAAAELLRHGIGTEPDEARAREMLEDACGAEPGRGACAHLADMLLRGSAGRRDPARAIALLEQACAADRARGCELLADSRPRGAADTRELYERARELYAILAPRSPWSEYRLGEMLREGKGVSADPRRAAEVLERACNRNEPLACRAAGSLFSDVGALDLRRARAANERACAAGLVESCAAAECQRKFAEGSLDDRAARTCRELGALGLSTAGARRKLPRRTSPTGVRDRPVREPLDLNSSFE